MPIEVFQGSPLAAALQTAVQPKLAEFGWSTGDDSTLCEYVILMLVNGKDEQQVASELASDLLDLPDSSETEEFARWLFGEVDRLSRQQTVEQDAPAIDMAASHLAPTESQPPSHDAQGTSQDAQMEEAAEPSPAVIPTGPKAMRNGNGHGLKPARGDKRMINQLNRHMDRSDDSPLHRIRGTAGTGRINSHSREPPKGPRSQQVGRGITAIANGRGMGRGAMGGMDNMNNMNNMGGMNNMGAMGGMPGMLGMPGMPGMGMQPMNQLPDLTSLSPQQQMALFKAYERSAQEMSQIFNGQTPAPYVNPNFQAGHRNGLGRGKPLSERVSKSAKPANHQQLPPSTKFSAKKEDQDENMMDTSSVKAGGDDSMSMDFEATRPDPAQTMCKFNLHCSKPDCPFAHQSPASIGNVTVDVTDVCSYGAACTNKKCAGTHPSPAKRTQHIKSEVECRFYPNCANMATCPFKHPSMPPCRNGADCTTPGCKFAHSQVMCRYTPCTNRYCLFKHAEGQKKQFEDKVWVAPGSSKDHVSERKFVDEEAEEELILPGRTNPEDAEITA
jgi:hypothetical protein